MILGNKNNMKRIYYFFIILFIILIFGCKKERVLEMDESFYIGSLKSTIFPLLDKKFSMLKMGKLKINGKVFLDNNPLSDLKLRLLFLDRDKYYKSNWVETNSNGEYNILSNKDGIVYIGWELDQESANLVLNGKINLKDSFLGINNGEKGKQIKFIHKLGKGPDIYFIQPIKVINPIWSAKNPFDEYHDKENFFIEWEPVKNSKYYILNIIEYGKINNSNNFNKVKKIKILKNKLGYKDINYNFKDSIYDSPAITTCFSI